MFLNKKKIYLYNFFSLNMLSYCLSLTYVLRPGIIPNNFSTPKILPFYIKYGYLRYHINGSLPQQRLQLPQRLTDRFKSHRTYPCNHKVNICQLLVTRDRVLAIYNLNLCVHINYKFIGYVDTFTFIQVIPYTYRCIIFLRGNIILIVLNVLMRIT